MKIEFLPRDTAERDLVRLAGDCDTMDWAVAWARPSHRVLDAAYRHQAKFRRLVMGTHFHQTNPEVLRAFAELPAARMVLPEGDTFHPKVYLFRLGAKRVAIVGSHNLTPKAFNGNAEMSVRIHGAADDAAFATLDTFMKEEWSNAVNIGEHVDSYTLQYKVKQKHLKELQQFNKHVRKPAANSENPSPFELTWQDFVRAIEHSKQSFQDIAGRLAILRRAKQLFEAKASLNSMTEIERKAVAGTYGKGEPGLDRLPWGWFGTMGGNGDFRSLVTRKNSPLSHALDEIPLSADVDESQFRAFVKAFKRAFKDAAHVGDYATGTRLAAMKRPDLFVAVNSKNVRPLCRALGTPYTTLRLESYWVRVVEPMRLSEWWNQPAPRMAREREIWDGRMALLDSIYYEA